MCVCVCAPFLPVLGPQHLRDLEGKRDELLQEIAQTQRHMQSLNDSHQKLEADLQVAHDNLHGKDEQLEALGRENEKLMLELAALEERMQRDGGSDDSTATADVTTVGTQTISTGAEAQQQQLQEVEDYRVQCAKLRDVAEALYAANTSLQAKNHLLQSHVAYVKQQLLTVQQQQQQQQQQQRLPLHRHGGIGTTALAREQVCAHACFAICAHVFVFWLCFACACVIQRLT